MKETVSVLDLKVVTRVKIRLTKGREELGSEMAINVERKLKMIREELE